MLKLLVGIKEKSKSGDGNLYEAYGDQNIEDEAQEVQPSSNMDMKSKMQPTLKRKANVEISNYFAPRTTPGSQPSLKSVLSSTQAIHKAKMAIAHWFYDACIPFHATLSPYFQPALDAINAIGPGFKGPSYHELRVNLLGDCKRECCLLVEGYRANWAKSGCTIMADGWTDQRQRTLINFLVYCPTGVVFVKSVDASDVIKDAKTLCGLFSEVVEWVGAEHIVHIVTDNAANYVAAGKLIQEKYDTIFWSPCAAHCLNLLLKDFASMPHVADLATKSSKITVFVYNHMVFLSWMRKREGWKEIVHPGVTRFATTFITLKSIFDHKHDLQALVVDKHFTIHKLSKTTTGKIVSDIVLDQKFWNDYLSIAKLVAPIIRLLRIVDGDEKPSLGYVYEGMQRAKNAIKKMFRNRRALYKPYTYIIKARWDKHLKLNLHAAAYFLNPAFFYDEKFCSKNRVMSATISLLEKRAFCNDLTKGISEMNMYRERQGSFGRESALIVTKTTRPDQWWALFGGSAPILQKLLKKPCYDPIDYESIDHVDFWVTEEQTPPELDIDEIDNFLYHENAIPVGQSSKNNEGDEDLDVVDFQVQSGDGGGSSTNEEAFPNILEFEGINFNEYYDD
ncbi:peroxisome bioproteinsis protein 12 [Hibiscus syriacus]|uniref:Peroxisome bioproteinsis protein 12 n=1 Tax=Hibiscus syriacus TaxID=106335 RepID=A0A6A3BXH4_HIBSY|nr:peroxisome bioproteinsis protein 12 [Hibiscus syriacus]